jgi:Sulfotransferase domain
MDVIGAGFGRTGTLSLKVALEGVYFWRGLIDKYPDAKVVLTLRDPEQWYASAERTIWAAANTPVQPHMVAFREMCDATNWTGTFRGRFGDREYAMRVFTEHNEEVRRTVPADRLLEYRVGEGWEPLCAFLGVSVSDAEFPRLNDAAAFQERIGLPRV